MSADWSADLSALWSADRSSDWSVVDEVLETYPLFPGPSPLATSVADAAEVVDGLDLSVGHWSLPEEILQGLLSVYLPPAPRVSLDSDDGTSNHALPALPVASQAGVQVPDAHPYANLTEGVVHVREVLIPFLTFQYIPGAPLVSDSGHDDRDDPGGG
jgi:hypothetical protein